MNHPQFTYMYHCSLYTLYLFTPNRTLIDRLFPQLISEQGHIDSRYTCCNQTSDEEGCTTYPVRVGLLFSYSRGECRIA